MFGKIVLALALSAAAVVSQDRRPTDQSYLFAMDTDQFLYSPLVLSFSCEGREYGYYADAANNCQVFHICLPVEDDFGAVVETAHWSFICGNGTIFDQSTLVCNHPQDSLPCDKAESYYNQVLFGVIDNDY